MPSAGNLSGPLPAAPDSAPGPAWPEGLARAILLVLSVGWVVVDARGQVRQAGEARADDPIAVVQGRLSLRAEAERIALRAAIVDALSGRQGGTLIAVSTAAGERRTVAVAPLALDGPPLALVLFQRRQADQHRLRDHFFRLHALTRSEAVVAGGLLDGHTPAEIAQQSGMTLQTVRSYLKHVLAKSGTHRQSAFVSLFYATVYPVGAGMADGGPARTGPPLGGPPTAPSALPRHADTPLSHRTRPS